MPWSWRGRDGLPAGPLDTHLGEAPEGDLAHPPSKTTRVSSDLFRCTVSTSRSPIWPCRPFTSRSIESSATANGSNFPAPNSTMRSWSDGVTRPEPHQSTERWSPSFGQPGSGVKVDSMRFVMLPFGERIPPSAFCHRRCDLQTHSRHIHAGALPQAYSPPKSSRIVRGFL